MIEYWKIHCCYYFSLNSSVKYYLLKWKWRLQVYKLFCCLLGIIPCCLIHRRPINYRARLYSFYSQKDETNCSPVRCRFRVPLFLRRSHTLYYRLPSIILTSSFYTSAKQPFLSFFNSYLLLILHIFLYFLFVISKRKL